MNALVDYEGESVKLAGITHKFQPTAGRDSLMFAVYNELDAWKKEFPDTFSPEGTPMGKLEGVFMHFDMGEHLPIRQRACRIPLTKRLLVERELQKMLSEGIIVPSSSPWASPITLVNKKDGGIRFCADFRRVNSVSKKEAHPLPHVQDIFDSLAGATMFSTLDLKSAYWQIPLDKKVWKKLLS